MHHPFSDDLYLHERLTYSANQEYFFVVSCILIIFYTYCIYNTRNTPIPPIQFRHI